MTKKTVVSKKAVAPVKAAKKAVAKKAAKKAVPAKVAKAAKKAAAKVETPKVEAPAKRETKKGQALEMLKEGATIFQLMETFGWLRHTTRGFLSILGRTHKLETFKNEKGEHTYKLAA